MTRGAVRERVEDRARERADGSPIVLDDAQVALLDRIDRFLADGLAAGGAAPDLAAGAAVGLYVHGPAGRGKSFLTRAAFDATAVPDEARRRVHFHSFFEALQRNLGPRVTARDAIERTTDELLDGAELFLFDELHVNDPGGAALLNRLLTEIVARRIPTLATSNYEPRRLFPNPVYQHVFAPSIRIIEERFEVVRLDAGVDYRERGGDAGAGFAGGRWIVAADDAGARAAGLDAPRSDEETTVAHGRFAYRARAVRGRRVWFSFADLLEGNSTPEDYLDWAARFDEWTVDGLPSLAGASPAARTRLVHLVDVLTETDRTLTVLSPVTRDRLVDVPEPPVDFFRTTSRLAMLRAG